MTTQIFHYIFTFILTIFLIQVFRIPAQRIGLLDVPGGRKTHVQEVPLIGGIAILCSFLLNVLFIPEPLRHYSSLFLGMGILLITGALDDFHDISAKSKLAVQILAAVIMTSWGGHTVIHVGNLLGTGDIGLGNWSLPFTVLCVVGLINAINMTDGMDGLAGGIALTAAGWLTVIAIWIGATTQTSLLLLLIAGITGFMVFNYRHPLRKQAVVFMGDAGSMMLGFALAWFAVDLHQHAVSNIPPITIAWIVALPILDTTILMARRLLKQQSPFTADREHLHHIFLRAGYSHTMTVNIIIVLNITMGAIGVAGWHYGIPDAALFIGLLFVLFAHLYFVLRAWRTMKALKRLRRWKSK